MYKWLIDPITRFESGRIESIDGKFIFIAYRAKYETIIDSQYLLE